MHKVHRVSLLCSGQCTELNFLPSENTYQVHKTLPEAPGESGMSCQAIVTSQDPGFSHSGVMQSVSSPSRELHNVHYIPQPLEGLVDAIQGGVEEQ